MQRVRLAQPLAQLELPDRSRSRCRPRTSPPALARASRNSASHPHRSRRARTARSSAVDSRPAESDSGSPGRRPERRTRRRRAPGLANSARESIPATSAPCDASSCALCESCAFQPCSPLRNSTTRCTSPLGPIDRQVLEAAMRERLGAALRSAPQQQQQTPSAHFENTPRSPPAINVVTSAIDRSVATPGGAAR